MFDRYAREIRGMRISITQKCNLRCFYCHNEGQKKSDWEMSSKEIERIVGIGKRIGIRKLKITGGEPLLRNDVVEIVEKASEYMDEISMTTNGILLDKYAGVLKNAGLARVNISLDSLNHETYKYITGVSKLQSVITGIKTAAEIMPVKINMVVMKNVNENEIENMIKFANENNVTLQLIEIETDKKHAGNGFYRKYHHDLQDIENGLKEKALSIEVRRMHHRKKYFLPFNSGKVQVEVVRPMHNSEFCKNCSRIRITSDGKIKSCLFDKNCMDIVSLIKNNSDDNKLMEAFEKVVYMRKPYWR